MSKLQILITQYNEDEALIKPLLDSIEHQYNIDLQKDIEVFIGNDGSDTKLSVEFLQQYSFPIQYHFFEHSRLAGCRGKLFNLATADYIMYCDADDMFLSNIAISQILLMMEKGFDMLVADFVEESHVTGKLIYIPHTKDPVFVHGKVYRRQFLLDNEIIWHPELHENQDSPFNVLSLTCSKNTKYLLTPIYMWRHNPNSCVRKDGPYHSVKYWPHMIDAYEALIDDLSARSFGVQAAFYSKYCLYATYYEMSHKPWHDEGIEQYVIATYNRIVQFYKKYHLMIESVSEENTKKVIEMTQKVSQRHGKLGEMPPFDEWLHSILKIFKG